MNTCKEKGVLIMSNGWIDFIVEVTVVGWIVLDVGNVRGKE